MQEKRYKELYDLESSHWWYAGKRKIVLSLLDKYLKSTTDLKILDAGCGTGIFLNALRRYGTPTGLDFSEEALGFCRLRGLTSLVKGSATEVPFEERSFDLVTALDLLEHVEEDILALKEFNRVLAEDGLLVVTVPACTFLWSEHDLALSHLRRYCVRELKRKMVDANFEILKLSYTNFFIFPVAFLIRLGKNLFQPVRSGGEKTEYATDIIASPKWVNIILERIYSLEAFWLKRFNFPIGTSLVCVARKKP